MTTPQTPQDIPPQYDAASTERALYAEWEAAGVFHADAARSKQAGGDRDPFVIVMPPPNVTGVLHMGHGLNLTVQDVLIRWRRMAGDEALWLPGTDHAGIATQNVVEKLLAKQGKTRFDLGRDAFVDEVKSFVDEKGGIILDQIRALGASCDWTRKAYTFSPELSRGVREVFVRLYDDGLIYRGHRVIHWCSRCLTSLSDEEAEFVDETGALYHIRYPLADNPDDGVTVATTRPETMLGDVAVAVHPEDERYQHLIGKMLRLPVAGVEIPVIADEYVDRAFGTGALKITPAHDANDFEVGKRHGLAMPVILAPDGTLAEFADAAGRVPDALKGIDRVEARWAVLRQLKTEGFLVKKEPHPHSVRHCYRCDTVVEPRLSDQWFVKMAPLAAPALEAVRSGATRILPERWEAVYVNWMENIRDWNISRQIWWGHRIPVWHCEGCSGEKAYREAPTTCPSCGGTELTQDEDVLDTWFSSWLWPFSTLGWPDKDTLDQRAFYPTDVLVTAPEILFFWVARMIMSGYYCMGKTPFHTVYLHGTARDAQRRRMSKSLGNGVDPLDVVNTFGADALRFTVISGLGLGTDLLLDHEDLEKSFAPGRNFATKLWNIGRFLLMSVGNEPVRPLTAIDPSELTLEDRWILGRLRLAIQEADSAIGPVRPSDAAWPENLRSAGLRLDEYAESARRFVWNELADWYLEATKGRLAQAGSDREVARSVLVHAFDTALRLLHPIMPFITEDLWRRLPGHVVGTFIARAAWPVAAPADRDGGAGFEVARDAINAIRSIRAQYAIAPGQIIVTHFVAPQATLAEGLVVHATLIERMAKSQLVAGAAPTGAAAHAVLANSIELVVPLAGVVDLTKECAKLKGEAENLEKQLMALRDRLSNEKFTGKAPPELVEAERAKERDWSARVAQLQAKVRTLCG